MDYCETLNIAFPFWIYIWTRIIRIEDIYRQIFFIIFEHLSEWFSFKITRFAFKVCFEKTKCISTKFGQG